MKCFEKRSQSESEQWKALSQQLRSPQRRPRKQLLLRRPVMPGPLPLPQAAPALPPTCASTPCDDDCAATAAAAAAAEEELEVVVAGATSSETVLPSAVGESSESGGQKAGKRRTGRHKKELLDCLRDLDRITHGRTRAERALRDGDLALTMDSEGEDGEGGKSVRKRSYVDPAFLCMLVSRLSVPCLRRNCHSTLSHRSQLRVDGVARLASSQPSAWHRGNLPCVSCVHVLGHRVAGRTLYVWNVRKQSRRRTWS